MSCIDTSCNQIPVLVAIDIEPEGRAAIDGGDEEFLGLALAADRFRFFRSELSRRFNSPVRFNWFLRMDPQIRESYGRADWIAFRYRQIFEEFQNSGDELGLHVHAWRREENSQQDFSDYGNQAWVEECVRTSALAYEEAFGKRPRSIRMGDRWLNNATVELLEELEFSHDLTIEPGFLPFAGNPVERMTGSTEDYRRAPVHPYRASRSDFLQPAMQCARNVWMIPITTGSPGACQWTVNLACDPENNMKVIDACLASTDNPILAIVGRSGDFSKAEYRANFYNNVWMLENHSAVSRFAFVNPDTAIEMWQSEDHLECERKQSHLVIEHFNERIDTKPFRLAHFLAHVLHKIRALLPRSGT